MPAIITCECSAKIRLPEGAPAAGMRCPKCKQPLNPPATPASGVAVGGAGGVGAAPNQVGLTCPVCQTQIAGGEHVRSCDSCGQVHHAECWNEVGGCATYGCPNAHHAPKSQPGPVPLSAWGDTKLCPICGERIKAIAVKCRYCATSFDSVDPMTAEDVRHGVASKEATKSLRTAVCVYSAVNVIGLLAPLMLLIGLAWLVPSRKRIARLGPAYVALGWIGLGMSVLYSTLMLVFIVLD
jgi:hypothetical protein